MMHPVRALPVLLVLWASFAYAQNVWIGDSNMLEQAAIFPNSLTGTNIAVSGHSAYEWLNDPNVNYTSETDGVTGTHAYIMLGTNDASPAHSPAPRTPAEYKADIESLIALAKTDFGTVTLLTPIKHCANQDARDWRIRKYRRALFEICEADATVGCIDLWPVLDDCTIGKWYADTAHANAAGAQIMADYVALGAAGYPEDQHVCRRPTGPTTIPLLVEGSP